MKFKILVAEPEEMFAEAVAYVLEKAGHEAITAHDSRYALDTARRFQPDLCILSADLPALARAHLCCDLIEEKALAPHASLFLLGTDTHEGFCASMLDCGVDDYLVKPFGMPEFMARVSVLLRRSHRVLADPQTGEWRAGAFALNLAERTLTIGDKIKARVLDVTQNEALLLQVLFENAGQVVTHETLLQKLGNSPAALRQLVKSLRRKIGDDAATPRHIISRHGQGFRFEP